MQAAAMGRFMYKLFRKVYFGAGVVVPLEDFVFAALVAVAFLSSALCFDSRGSSALISSAFVGGATRACANDELAPAAV